MNDLKSELQADIQNIAHIATEKLKQPEVVKRLSEHVDRWVSSLFRISIVHAPGIGTRKFAATVTNDLKLNEGIEISEFSLLQAVDALMKEDSSLIQTDYPVLIFDPGTRLTAEDHRRIDTLKLVFGDGIRYISVDSQNGAKREAVELLISIRSNYDQEQLRNIHAQLHQVCDRIKIQTQIWLFSLAEAKEVGLGRKFTDEFVPDFKKFVEFRLSEIFPLQVVNPTIRDKINSLSKWDLKMCSFSEIYTSIEAACVVTFDSELNTLGRECATLFLEFLNENFPNPKLVMPANASPPEVPVVTVTKPDMDFDVVDATINGVWGGVYPTAFAVLSSLQMGGAALGIPALVAAAFALQGYRTAKTQHEKSSLEIIKNELNQNSMMAGNKVKYEFEKRIQQMVDAALRAAADAQRDKEKTMTQIPDIAFLESAEYQQAVTALVTACNEATNRLNGHGKTEK